MGQEASLPMDGRVDEELEEQARAPPSTVNPAPVPGPQHQHSGKGRKLINGIIKRNQHNGRAADHNSNINNHHTHDLESYEQREAARAAAAGGNLYLRDPTSSEEFALQKMPSTEPVGTTFFQPTIRADEIAKAEEARKPPALEAVAAALGRAPPPHPHHETHPPIPSAASGGSSKKGLFQSSGRSARGMISTMRNLSIGGALRKQKDVQDWEKQWDEDEDDDEDESDEEDEHHQLQQQPPLHSLKTTAAAAPPAVMTGSSLQRASEPTDLLSGPPPVTASYASSSAGVSSSSLMAAETTTMQQQAAGPDWDTEGIPQAPREAAGRKPDVQMFLPMLRVLGKGSFGKVRLVNGWCVRMGWCWNDTMRCGDTFFVLFFRLNVIILPFIAYNWILLGQHRIGICIAGGPRTKARRKRTRTTLRHENPQKDAPGQAATN